MTGAVKLNTAGGGSVVVQPASSIASDVTVNVPSQNCTLGIQGPAFSAYRSTNQVMSSGTWTKIACNTEEYDTNSNYDNATNYRFTPTVAGYYQVSISADASASVSPTSSQLTIYKNGTGYKRNNNGVSSGTNMSAIVYCNGSTDYIEAYAFVVAGTAQLAAGISNTWFQGVLVRAA